MLFQNKNKIGGKEMCIYSNIAYRCGYSRIHKSKNTPFRHIFNFISNLYLLYRAKKMLVGIIFNKISYLFTLKIKLQAYRVAMKQITALVNTVFIFRETLCSPHCNSVLPSFYSLMLSVCIGYIRIRHLNQIP